MVLASTTRTLALFLARLDDGGAEHVMLQLAKSFSTLGHSVDLVVAVPGGPLESQVPSQVRLVDLGARRAILALPALVAYLRHSRPSALLSTLEYANVLALWARALSRAQTRVVVREASVARPVNELGGARFRAERWLMRRYYSRAESVVAVSRAVGISLIEQVGLPPARICTIYNPVVTDSLYVKAREPLEDPWFAPGAPPVVLGVGRLAPEKDFHSLISAFARVCSVRPAHLVILGEGPERASLEALSRQLGIESLVRLPGFDPNPFRYMQRSTVFVLSSVFEGLPGALIQAMACGCRVISTDCPGGSREVLEGSESGLLVPPRSVPELSAGILRHLEEAERNPGRIEHPVDRFSERASVTEYLRVLGQESMPVV